MITLIRAMGPVLSVAVTPAQVTPSAGADLPGTRNHFNGVDKPVDFILVDVDLLFGPLTPTPQLSLADVVRRVAG